MVLDRCSRRCFQKHLHCVFCLVSSYAVSSVIDLCVWLCGEELEWETLRFLSRRIVNEVPSCCGLGSSNRANSLGEQATIMSSAWFERRYTAVDRLSCSIGVGQLSIEWSWRSSSVRSMMLYRHAILDVIHRSAGLWSIAKAEIVLS